MNAEEVDNLLKLFLDKKNEIEAQVIQLNNDFVNKDADTIKNTDAIEKLDKLFDGYNNLSKEFNQYINTLPSYHVKSLSNQLSSLLAKIEEAKSNLIPKKKFTFGAKKVIAKPDANIQKQKIDPKDKDVIEDYTDLMTVKFKDLENEDNLVVERNEFDSKDILIENITKSTINFPGCPSTVYIKNVINSTINIGPISTSVFISNCKASELNLCAQQIRIHDSSELIIKAKVFGGSIIENCTQIKIKRYDYNYPDADKDLIKMNAHNSEDRWSEMVDFNWLSKDVKSPNFEVIDG